MKVLVTSSTKEGIEMKKTETEYDLLGVWLDFAFNSLVGELNRSLHSVGLPLNHAQFVILQNLFLKDGQSQNDIARRVGKDRAAISRSLNTLEENGFILRKAVSGSKNGIFLTEKAIENRNKITEAINMAIRKGRGEMTDEEYKNGMSFLRRLYENLHANEK
ncbi:MAG: MarR family transcriptional regulator [Muribaculaceae bacterium]|nr:MarR family transcriptional regulator [Muribaculaceae bacterium]